MGFSSLSICRVFILAALVMISSSVKGDDTCDATSADASGDHVCSPKVDDSQNVIDDVTSTKGSTEEVERPVWSDYNIDQLFEDWFDCGSIIYGYGGNDDDDDMWDDDDDDDLGGSSKDKQGQMHAENPEVVSENQLQKLRHQWAAIREKYKKEVNLVPIETQKVESNDGEISYRGVSALVVPNRVGDAGPKKGRGVFATEPIKEGELVVSLDNGSTGIFKDGHSWRKFAVSLLDKETACNFIEWSWVQTIQPRSAFDDDVRNGLTIYCAFDESNLMNSADWDGIDANVRCGTPPKSEGGDRGPCRYHYYAARDIAAGEELLIDYGEFEDLSQQGWSDVGL